MMEKNNIILSIIFFGISTFHLLAQDNFSIPFEKLEITETNYNDSLISTENILLKNNSSDFLIYSNTEKNIVEVIKNEKNKKVSFKIPFHISNIDEQKFNIIDSRFITFTVTETHGGRGLFSMYGEFYIIDIIHSSIAYIPKFSYSEYWEITGHNDSLFIDECNLDIHFENNELQIKRHFNLSWHNNEEDYQEFLESGKYIFKENKFIRTHFFNRKKNQYTPLHRINDICVGMPLDSMYIKYKKVQFIDRSVDYFDDYIFIHPSEKAYAINNFDFIISTTPGDLPSDRYIQRFFILSPKYNIQGITVDMSLEKIIKKYPESKLYIDLITNEEYLYIPSQNISVFFESEYHNRIGIYNNTIEGPATKIIQKKAKAIRIEIGE